ncbi:MAG: ribosomal L7Ae/L30e/S12e/Gadd45 family protein [Thaumarchaeota archaeon]|nr:ribosomal L7Ae/L30e/S12e/Gadd45 family protein [Nitrososphaerota archaeon]
MVDSTALSKILKEGMRGGKSALGAKESLAAMKGSKALLLTRSVPKAIDARLRAEAEKNNVSVVELQMTSAELARLVGRPYKVSTLALKSVTEADVKQLQR